MARADTGKVRRGLLHDAPDVPPATEAALPAGHLLSSAEYTAQRRTTHAPATGPAGASGSRTRSQRTRPNGSATTVLPALDADPTPRTPRRRALPPIANPEHSARDTIGARRQRSSLPLDTPGASHGPGPQRHATGPQSGVTASRTIVHAASATPIPAERAVVHARQVTAHDTAIIERTTRTVRAVGTDTVGTPVAEDSAWMLAAQWGEGTNVLVVAGSATAAVRAMPRRGPRGWRGVLVGSAMMLLCLAVVAGMLHAFTPVWGRQTSSGALVLEAATLAQNPLRAIPTGPWDTSSGAAAILGIGGGAGPGVKAPGSAGLQVKSTAQPPAAAPAPAPAPAPTGVLPPPIAPWPPSDAFMAVPGHPAFAVAYPADGYYGWAFGQCTWWAQDQRRDENLTHLGNALSWATSAAARGFYVTSVPKAGATVVFQPGVEGAGGGGHVAHVVAVYPDGWFLVSEMNFYWNGGGWGRVDYRFVHTGWGVQFIY